MLAIPCAIPLGGRRVPRRRCGAAGALEVGQLTVEQDHGTQRPFQIINLESEVSPPQTASASASAVAPGHYVVSLVSDAAGEQESDYEDGDSGCGCGGGGGAFAAAAADDDDDDDDDDDNDDDDDADGDDDDDDDEGYCKPKGGDRG